MTTRTDPQPLYDSEAALRLVDSALGELRFNAAPLCSVHELRTEPTLSLVMPDAPVAPAQAPAPAPNVDLPTLLLRAYGEITGVLTNLRQSRDAIAQASVERIQQAHEKLDAVTSATEVAAIDILDSLDRAQALLEELDTLDGGTSDGPAAKIRDRLRDELFRVTGCLQFQDITTQQLNHASSVLVDTEQRLGQLANIFDSGAFGLSPEPTEPPYAAATTFDPAASLAGADVRQALADQIFTSR